MEAVNEGDNAQEPWASGLRRAPHRPVRIAVVDDDRDMRAWLAHALDEAGFDVILAANGLRLVSTLQVDRPDLILLDVINSWIDGYELCRALKQNPQFREIPVIFLSGRSAPPDIERGMACGAVDYFAKPLDSRKLVRRIHELVEILRQEQ
jgi:DNA-binding response OmpR family regulator